MLFYLASLQTLPIESYSSLKNNRIHKNSPKRRISASSSAIVHNDIISSSTFSSNLFIIFVTFIIIIFLTLMCSVDITDQNPAFTPKVGSSLQESTMVVAQIGKEEEERSY